MQLFLLGETWLLHEQLYQPVWHSIVGCISRRHHEGGPVRGLFQRNVHQMNWGIATLTAPGRKTGWALILPPAQTTFTNVEIHARLGRCFACLPRLLVRLRSHAMHATDQQHKQGIMISISPITRIKSTSGKQSQLI